MPCNVTVHQLEDGQIEDAIVDPRMLLGAVRHPAVRQVAEEAREKLERVARTLALIREKLVIDFLSFTAVSMASIPSRNDRRAERHRLPEML